MAKILYIVSDVDKAVAFEWIASYYKGHPNISVSFCFLRKTRPITYDFIRGFNNDVKYLRVNGKKDWLRVIFQLCIYISKTRPDAIHCHLLEGSILGLSAGFLCHIKHRFLTRHHGSLHHTYHKKGLLWDYYCNILATKIVSISPATTKILCCWEQVNPSKIIHIPHGFPLHDFTRTDVEKISSFKHKYKIHDSKKLIGIVSRFVDWKGIEYTIEAFQALVNNRSDIHLLLMNATGPYASRIHGMLNNLPPSSWTTIEFYHDMITAYASMDILVHVPVDPYAEAFGQVYVESLASGLPLICTLSGIAPEFIVHKYNALVVPYRDSVRISEHLIRLLDSQDLREKLSFYGQKSVHSHFSLSSMFNKLDYLYSLAQ